MGCLRHPILVNRPMQTFKTFIAETDFSEVKRLTGKVLDELFDTIQRSVMKRLRLKDVDDIGVHTSGASVSGKKISVIYIAEADADQITPDKVILAQMVKALDDVKGYKFEVLSTHAEDKGTFKKFAVRTQVNVEIE